LELDPVFLITENFTWRAGNTVVGAPGSGSQNPYSWDANLTVQAETALFLKNDANNHLTLLVEGVDYTYAYDTITNPAVPRHSYTFGTTYGPGFSFLATSLRYDIAQSVKPLSHYIVTLPSATLSYGNVWYLDFTNHRLAFANASLAVPGTTITLSTGEPIVPGESNVLLIESIIDANEAIILEDSPGYPGFENPRYTILLEGSPFTRYLVGQHYGIFIQSDFHSPVTKTLTANNAGEARALFLAAYGPNSLVDEPQQI
jgi:hypothetical protein